MGDYPKSNVGGGMHSVGGQYRLITFAILFTALTYGLYSAISIAWVCDDAFISFRYAQNLVDGLGLVFNVGEKVEGYTNFLWTVILAGGMVMDLEPVRLSQILGIASYFITVIIFCILSVKVTSRCCNRRIFLLPLAALALLLHHDSHVFATSGLETSFVTALVSAAFALLLMARPPQYAGLMLTAAALTRPDALIFSVGAAVFVWLTAHDRRRSVFRLLLPILILYTPYWVIRFSQYGYPFPNTYYAKSVSEGYYLQGLTYLWMYVKTYYILLILPAGAIIFARRLSYGVTIARQRLDMSDRAWLLGLLFIVPYVAYIVRIGGDFMFARLMIPVTPITFYLYEVSINRLITIRSLRYAISVLVLASIALRWNQFTPETAIINHVADEPAFYPPSEIETAREQGEKLRHCLGDIDVTVGFYSSEAMLMYYSRLPKAIECDAGLTDEFIAHLPLRQRGRPGHEKKAPIDYLFRRHTAFIFSKCLSSATVYDRLRLISFDGVTAQMPAYNREIMRRLKGRTDVKFIDFEMLLDVYISNLDSIPEKQLLADAAFFNRFYFDHNNDPVRAYAISSRVSLCLAAKD